MALGRKNLVDVAQAALEEAQAAREKAAEEIAGQHARRHQFADDPAAYEANENEISKFRSEHHRLGLVIAKRESELEQAIRTRDLAAYDAAVAERDAAAEKAGAEAKSFAGYLARAAASAGKLDELRREVDRLDARARELRPSGVEERLAPDEPSFPADLEHLVETAQAGPRQPRASAKAALENARAAAENSDRTRIRWALDDPDLIEARIQQLDEPLRAQAVAAAIERFERQLKSAEVDVRTRFANPNLHGGHDLSRSPEADRAVERTVEALTSRIKQLRELDLAVGVAA